ncbi:MAG TPA: heparan-alpha-glucosaminide N-acetyltransferase domain-containing protein [Candidatus Sulfotelmatobacter sp.]|nr:heparan-alpha-glucosaminide N-acetyltransferase domain-containing protein [Candidatus Sulfotelmatobacter sp.]
MRKSENTSTANAPIQSVSPAAPSAARGLGRIDSIDILRGLVMVIMALDHTRDFFTNLRFEPENLANTYYALFFTRWITHFCAPLFFFLAGTGAFFYGRRRTPEQLSLFLWTRGLWLILLEFTVIGTAWSFQFPWGFFGVIWALGASMVIMAAAVRLPVRWLAGISIAVIATHELFDRVRPKQFGEYGWIWSLLHVREFVMLPFQIPEFVLFQIVPWCDDFSALHGARELARRVRRRLDLERLCLPESTA